MPLCLTEREMKMKHLESALQEVTLYSQLNPGSARIELEQYSTSPHLAARMVYTAHMEYDDIEDRCAMCCVVCIAKV